MSGTFIHSITIFALFLGGTAVYADIPKDIDVSKFQEIHDRKKSDYEGSRTEASRKQTDYAARVRDREGLQAELRRLEAQIELNEATIAAVEKNIAASVSEQEGMRASINTATAQSKELQAELEGLDASLRTARARLTTQDNTVTVAAQSKLDLEAELRRAREDLRTVVASLAKARTSLQEAREEETRLARELRTLEDRLGTKRTEKNGLSNESLDLTAREKVLAASLRDRQAELARHSASLDQATREQTRANEAVEAAAERLSQVNTRVIALQRRIEKLTEEIRQAEATSKEAEKTLTAASNAVAQLDIVKEELEGKLGALTPEIARAEQDLTRVGDQIARVREQLATAEGDKKEELERRLATLQTREGELREDIQGKRREEKALRDRILEIPAKKAEKRREELAAQRALEQAKAAVTSGRTELATAQNNLRQLTQEERDCERELSDAHNTLRTASAAVKTATDQRDAAQSSINTMRAEQARNQTRQSELATLLRNLEREIHALENDSIPTVKSTQAENARTIQRLNTEETTLVRQQGEKERTVTRIEAQVASATEVLARETRSRDEISREIDGYLKRQSLVSSSIAAIAVSNKALERSIAALEQEQVLPQKKRVTELTQSNRQLRTARDTTKASIDQALDVERFAKAAFDAANERAVTLRKEWEVAAADLSTVQANYELGRTRAVAEGAAAGKAGGAREAVERASVQGDAAGKTEGDFDGNLEGGKDRRQTVYDEALERAYRMAYDEVKREKTAESAAEAQERRNQPDYQARYGAGEKSGKDLGYRDGFKEGDNAAREAAGKQKGVADGKAEAEALARQSHEPLGRKAKEEEIRSSRPKHQVEKDLRAEPARVGALFDRMSERLATLAADLWDALVPSARADRGKGVLRPQDVPAPTHKYPAGAVSYAHPDYDKAYADAYRDAYVKSYFAEYIAVHKSSFDAAYDVAYGKAFKEASDPKKEYPEEKARGEAKGTILGRYEGYGFNAAYAEFKAKGLAEGEARAFARGYDGAKEPAKQAHLPIAQKAAFEAGKAEVESYYRNNAVAAIAAGAGSAELSDANGDGKFSFGESIALSLRVRNFGGVDTAPGELTVRFDSRRVSGISLPALEVPLSEVEQDTEVLFRNVTVGKIGPGASVRIAGALFQGDREVGRFEVEKEVFSPYSIKFTYEYDLNKGLVVPSVDGRTGAYNFVWVHSDNEAALADLDSVQIAPVDPSLVGVSRDSTGFLKLGAPIQKVWRRPNHFALYGFRAQGLQDNKMRVILKNKKGEIVFDREVLAPVTVQR